MRLALLLLLIALAPFAAAQAERPVLVVDVQDAAPVAPLAGNTAARFAVTVDCTLLVTSEPRAEVRVSVVEAPVFATTKLSPAVFALDTVACRQRAETFEGAVTIAVDERAPALVPFNVTLGASIEGASGNVSAKGTGAFTAAYFAIVDASLDRALAEAPPGGAATFQLRLDNKGNGRTTVALRAENATGGLSVDALPTVTLESAQQGGAATQETVEVVVRTSEGAGFVNEVGVVDLVVEPSHADGPEKGEPTRVSLVVTTKGLSTPGPGALAFVVALACVVVARRGR